MSKIQVFTDIANGKDFAIECVWCNGRIISVSDVTIKEPSIKLVDLPIKTSKIERIRNDFYKRFTAGEYVRATALPREMFDRYK